MDAHALNGRYAAGWRRNPHSLRSRIRILIVIVLAVALMVLAGAILRFVYVTEQAAWRGRQSEAAANAATTVAAFMSRVEDSLGVAALMVTHAPRNASGVLQSLLARNPALVEIVHLSRDGTIFTSAAVGNDVLTNLFTIPQSQWFIRASQGDHYRSGVEVSPTDDLYMVVAAPDGMSGVVAARVDMRVLLQVVNNIRFGASGRAYVIDSDGRVVAHTAPNMVAKQVSLSGSPEFAAIRSAPDHVWYGTYANLDGATVVGASAAIRGTSWIVVTELPSNEAFRTTYTALLALSGGLLVFGVLLSLALTKALDLQILQPLEDLRIGAQRVGAGDLSYRVRVQRRDEIGLLAATLNDMVTQLKDRDLQLARRADQLAAEVTERTRVQEALHRANEELEARVAERTAELSRLNAQLQMEMAERQQAMQAIEVSLREKEVLLKEIHHRVKNNLQVLSSLLSLQAGSETDGAVLLALEDSQNRVRSMAMIHEKIYRSESLAAIDFGEYVRDLAGHLFDAYDAVARSIFLRMNVDRVSLSIETAVPCGLLLNELLSNCFKHAFPHGQGGQISIDLHRSTVDDNAVLTVTDNGAGLPDDFDISSCSTLGLRLVRILVDQIDGRLELLKRTTGTSFRIQFPVPVGPDAQANVSPAIAEQPADTARALSPEAASPWIGAGRSTAPLWRTEERPET